MSTPCQVKREEKKKVPICYYFLSFEMSFRLRETAPRLPSTRVTDWQPAVFQ